MPTITLRPNAAGDKTDIDSQYPESGSHWDKVDETGAGDDMSTYILQDIGGTERDLFNIPNHTGEEIGVISNITVYTKIKGVTNGAISPAAQIIIKTRGTEYAGGAISFTNSFALYSKTWTTNPGGGVWTWADIDALQIGMEMYGELSSPYQGVTYCTQLYVIVTYTGTFLHYKKGATVYGIAIETLAGHKLRIRRGATTYGIPLVATDAANASPIRIYDGIAIKALEKKF